ncbi:Short transient receptor potential channel 4-associated protein like protein [Aduncisulcus paluster]|uniref:Short transient receptor potential channel 4-associated protein like protein n=1 Tax=Aduncisulcus paluster TaxID=2918883 RepID=A0ABQ5KUW5_9EUKA|nr:Short transient receptor potential channel 4-associated protein like protein [Aduncisulcus paluster]
MLRNVFSSSFLIAFRPFIRKCLQNTVNPILGTQCSLFLAELSNFTNHDIDFFQCPDLPDRIAQMSPYVFSSFVFVINSCCTQKSVFDIGSDTIDILKDGHKDRAFLRPFGTTISHRNFSLLAEVAPRLCYMLVTLMYLAIRKGIEGEALDELKRKRDKTFKEKQFMRDFESIQLQLSTIVSDISSVSAYMPDSSILNNWESIHAIASYIGDDYFPINLPDIFSFSMELLKEATEVQPQSLFTTVGMLLCSKQKNVFIPHFINAGIIRVFSVVLNKLWLDIENVMEILNYHRQKYWNWWWDTKYSKEKERDSQSSKHFSIIPPYPSHTPPFSLPLLSFFSPLFPLTLSLFLPILSAPHVTSSLHCLYYLWGCVSCGNIDEFWWMSPNDREKISKAGGKAKEKKKEDCLHQDTARLEREMLREAHGTYDYHSSTQDIRNTQTFERDHKVSEDINDRARDVFPFPIAHLNEILHGNTQQSDSLDSYQGKEEEITTENPQSTSYYVPPQIPFNLTFSHSEQSLFTILTTLYPISLPITLSMSGNMEDLFLAISQTKKKEYYYWLSADDFKEYDSHFGKEKFFEHISPPESLPEFKNLVSTVGVVTRFISLAVTSMYRGRGGRGCFSLSSLHGDTDSYSSSHTSSKNTSYSMNFDRNYGQKLSSEDIGSEKDTLGLEGSTRAVLECVLEWLMAGDASDWSDISCLEAKFSTKGSSRNQKNVGRKEKENEKEEEEEEEEERKEIDFPGLISSYGHEGLAKFSKILHKFDPTFVSKQFDPKNDHLWRSVPDDSTNVWEKEKGKEKDVDIDYSLRVPIVQLDDDVTLRGRGEFYSKSHDHLVHRLERMVDLIRFGQQDITNFSQIKDKDKEHGNNIALFDKIRQFFTQPKHVEHNPNQSVLYWLYEVAKTKRSQLKKKEKEELDSPFSRFVSSFSSPSLSSSYFDYAQTQSYSFPETKPSPLSSLILSTGMSQSLFDLLGLLLHTDFSTLDSILGIIGATGFSHLMKNACLRPVESAVFIRHSFMSALWPYGYHGSRSPSCMEMGKEMGSLNSDLFRPYFLPVLFSLASALPPSSLKQDNLCVLNTFIVLLMLLQKGRIGFLIPSKNRTSKNRTTYKNEKQQDKEDKEGGLLTPDSFSDCILRSKLKKIEIIPFPEGSIHQFSEKEWNDQIKLLFEPIGFLIPSKNRTSKNRTTYKNEKQQDKEDKEGVKKNSDLFRPYFLPVLFSLASALPPSSLKQDNLCVLNTFIVLLMLLQKGRIGFLIPSKNRTSKNRTTYKNEKQQDKEDKEGGLLTPDSFSDCILRSKLKKIEIIPFPEGSIHQFSEKEWNDQIKLLFEPSSYSEYRFIKNILKLIDFWMLFYYMRGKDVILFQQTILVPFSEFHMIIQQLYVSLNDILDEYNTRQQSKEEKKGKKEFVPFRHSHLWKIHRIDGDRKEGKIEGEKEYFEQLTRKFDDSCVLSGCCGSKFGDSYRNLWEDYSWENSDFLYSSHHRGSINYLWTSVPPFLGE